MSAKKRFSVLVPLLLLAACSSGGGDGAASTPDSKPEIGLEGGPEFLRAKSLGGDGTSTDFSATSFAFRYPMPTLSETDAQLHHRGDLVFEGKFSDDPSRPEFGMGPVSNNSSCIACHNRDGRGSLPTGLSESTWQKLGQNEAIFLRLSIEKDSTPPEKNEANLYGAPISVPGFTTQLFHLGTRTLRPLSPGDGQAELWLKLQKSQFVYPDGTVVELSKPLFKIENPYDQTVDPVTGAAKSRLFDSDVRMSPRMGMPMFGLGLLEMIPEQEIVGLSQVDHGPEGVHGKPNYVFDVEKYKRAELWPISLGRFGLKASTPTVAQQSLAALNGDIGVTNSFFPKESIEGTPLYEDFVKRTNYIPHLEATPEMEASVVFYSKTLAVPPRRDMDEPEVIRGGKLFETIRCTSCHTPSFTTGESPVAGLSKQKIFPFTDLLLHDMGEGLADGRRDFDADGRQWKTRALWGLGLTQIVNPRAGFLHDGRARTIEEAVLWHDGEAHFSRDKFTQLSREDRQRVLTFLRSL